MHIEMRKIENFSYFDPKCFCINPKHTEMYYSQNPNQLEIAKELASSCNGICVAIIHDEYLGEYVLAKPVDGEDVMRFVLFNAEEADENEGEVQVFTYRKKTGEVFSDCWMKYKKGKVW